MKSSIIVLAHHAFECGCSSMDVNLGEIKPSELAAILKIAGNMKGENVVMTKGIDLDKLNYRTLGKPSLEQLNQQLGVGPDEVIVAAVDAPEMFKLKNGKGGFFADDRLFFIYNKKTAKVRQRVFTPYTDQAASNRETGQDVAKAIQEGVNFGISRLRARVTMENELRKLADAGIAATIKTTEGPDGGKYVIEEDISNEAEIAAVQAVYDAENDIQ